MRRYLKLTMLYALILSLNVFNISKAQSNWLLLKPEDISSEPHNQEHFNIFSKYAKGYNLEVLKAIDSVQAHAMNGGGYFIGIDSIPTESPVGFNLKLLGKSLITPPRSTSYCSGSTYTVFITALNFIFQDKRVKISDDRIEAMRMQEPDGSRREDWVKYWGIWNADGFGSQYAMVQYSNMGIDIKPENAIPGDFMNISWKSGIGHSVVFLGWYIDKNGNKNIVYWASQKGTNGYGDQIVSLDKIKNVKVVRLTEPERLLEFDINNKINNAIPGDKIEIQN
jgi:hypothetical protein